MVASRELVAHNSADGSRSSARPQICAHSWGAVASSAVPAWMSSWASPRTSPASSRAGAVRLATRAASASSPLQHSARCSAMLPRRPATVSPACAASAMLASASVTRRREVARLRGHERPDGQHPRVLTRRPRVPVRRLVQPVPARAEMAGDDPVQGQCRRQPGRLASLVGLVAREGELAGGREVGVLAAQRAVLAELVIDDVAGEVLGGGRPVRHVPAPDGPGVGCPGEQFAAGLACRVRQPVPGDGRLPRRRRRRRARGTARTYRQGRSPPR